MRSILPLLPLLALLALTTPAATFDLGTHPDTTPIEAPGSPKAGALDSDDEPCEVPCNPHWAQLENEPPLVDFYADAHNGGCNSPEFGSPFQYLEQGWFCGISGWYMGEFGQMNRDTDWFHVSLGVIGDKHIHGIAEHPTYMFELAPQDCGSVEVVQSVVIEPCNWSTIHLTGAPWSVVWLWVGPTTFNGPVNEYRYLLEVPYDPLSNEDHSWSSVKSLFH